MSGMRIRFTRVGCIALAILAMAIAFFILPNLFNTEEKRAFSDELRLEYAKRDLNIHSSGDSGKVVPGKYYHSNAFKKYFLGVSYRDLWQQEVQVPVLKLRNAKARYEPVAFTGGLQTIGIKVKDVKGQFWSVRSVNKDQSAALPTVLRISALRALFRDRACSMDPYGSLAVAKFSEALGLHSLQPQLFLFPYDTKLGKYNQRMAGRLVMLQKRWDSDLKDVGGEKISILDTEKALANLRNRIAVVDTRLYLRTRLLDLLIADWDRHKGNWKWLLKDKAGRAVLEPIAVDRDMAFYNFGEGLVNRIVLALDNRFQSFNLEFNGIEGLMKQSQHLDRTLLKSVERSAFLEEAQYIQTQLSEHLVAESFSMYPKPAYEVVGKSHRFILKERLRKLPEVALKFHELIQVKEH